MENFIQLVKYPEPMSVQGFEALSIGDSFNLFFKEFSTSVDKKMAALSKSVHQVNIDHAKKHIKSAGVMYVKNTGQEILTPEGFAPGMGSMMAHTKSVIAGVYLIASLRTESARLYDWMKQILTQGRVDQSFGWTISDFGRAVDRTENFIKNLPDRGRSVRYTLGQVYMSFEEFYDVVNEFNHTVSTLGGRDVEMIARDLSNVYSLSQLLVKKVKSSEFTLPLEGINDIEAVVNKFINLTNICGAVMVLLNELTAVFTAQADAICKMK